MSQQQQEQEERRRRRKNLGIITGVVMLIGFFFLWAILAVRGITWAQFFVSVVKFVVTALFVQTPIGWVILMLLSWYLYATRKQKGLISLLAVIIFSLICLALMGAIHIHGSP